MLSKRYESTEVDRRTWLHMPSGTHWSISSDTYHLSRSLFLNLPTTWMLIWSKGSHYKIDKIRLLSTDCRQNTNISIVSLFLLISIIIRSTCLVFHWQLISKAYRFNWIPTYLQKHASLNDNSLQVWNRKLA